MPSNPIALNVGCGLKHADFEGYETKQVDIREDVGADVIARVDDLPYKPGTIGLIYAAHLYEHFTVVEGRKILAKWHDLLVKPGGRLWLVVPNLEWACRQILRDGKPEPHSHDILYGGQTHDWNFHKTGFTPRSIRELIERQGLFKVVSCEPTERGDEIHLKGEAVP